MLTRGRSELLVRQARVLVTNPGNGKGHTGGLGAAGMAEVVQDGTGPTEV